LRAAYEQECRIRQGLEAAAADDAERIRVLSASLDAATPVSPLNEPGLIGEVDSLKVALQSQADRLDEAARSKEEVEIALHQAHDLIASLEKMIRETAGAAEGDPLAAASREKNVLQVLELQEQLRSVEGQLDWQRAEQDRLAEALAAAEMQLGGRQELPSPGRAQRKERRIPEPAIAREAIAEVRVKSAKPLPHELRPAPKKGAPFHPDWDLPGLPCRSAAQVDKAWETAFNVQISLEGYPSQYCMAFLVVLGTGTQKQLYMLFRLKKNKHTLVYVPAKTPEDEASLQKAIADGLKYLKRSGFEMEEIAVENIDSALGSYFQGV